MMWKKLAGVLLASAPLLSAPAHADVSIMYVEWLSSLVEPGIKAYEEKTGEKVEAIKLPRDGYLQRLSLDLASGTAADVLQVDSFVVSEFASSGYLMPLTDMVAKWDQFPFYSKAILDVVSYDGQVYSLPTDTDVRMLWYNKALMEKAGIALPWEPKNWDDMLDAGRAIQKATGVDNALFLPAGTKQGEAATMQGFYMALLGGDKPGEGRNRLRDWDAGKWIGDSPAIRRTLELYKTLYVDEKLADSGVNYSTDPRTLQRELMRNGEIGIMASGSWEFSCIWDCTGKTVPSVEERDAQVGWTPWPGSGEPGAMAHTNISGGWTIGLNKAAKDPDKAFGLLTAIFDRSNFEPWVVGNKRMAVRSDIAESEGYTSDPYLTAATKLVSFTTGRDTYPGYQIVSAAVQQMTADILDGASVDEAVETYHNTLVDEFGEENVKVIE